MALGVFTSAARFAPIIRSSPPEGADMPEQAMSTPTLLRFPDRRLNPPPHGVDHDSGAPGIVNFTGRASIGVPSHHELEEKLAELRVVQPQAPLSFLAIQVHGLNELKLRDWRRPSDIVNILAHNVRCETRVTDFVGRLDGSAIGVILQGSGHEQCTAIAERLRISLARLSHTAPPIDVTVSAASGRGINAHVLPKAVLSPLGECS